MQQSEARRATSASDRAGVRGAGVPPQRRVRIGPPRPRRLLRAAPLPVFLMSQTDFTLVFTHSSSRENITMISRDLSH